MEPLRCIAVDDEPLPLQLISDYIQRTPILLLTGTYTNPLEALSVVHQQRTDLIFLDIQMPELSGIQFMQLLNGKSKVIFITAYPNYALQGYELDVIDYLLKPVSMERFLKAAGKAWDTIQNASSVSTNETINTILPVEEVLFVKSGYKIIKILITDILYLEGLKEYIAIHTTKGKVITLQSIKKMESVLPKSYFIRVHKSFIVAINKIDSIERNRIFIGKDIIPIGEVYKEDFYSNLNIRKLL